MTGSDYDHNKLRALREEAGLSVADVAGRIGRTRMMIYLAENGNGPISYRTLKALAEVYGVRVASLLHPAHAGHEALEHFSPVVVNTA